MMNKTDLGIRLRQARLQKGYTQHQLAEKAQISLVYLGEVERGKKMPSLNSFIRIVEALGISADYILRDELPSGEAYVFDELTEKLRDLSPGQRRVAGDILDAYIKSI